MVKDENFLSDFAVRLDCLFGCRLADEGFADFDCYFYVLQSDHVRDLGASAVAGSCHHRGSGGCGSDQYFVFYYTEKNQGNPEGGSG